MSKRTLAYDTVAEKTVYRSGGVEHEITIEGGSGIPDAPLTGGPYAREDGEWVEVAGADALSSHVGAKDNPHAVTASQVGALATGAFAGVAKITVGATAPVGPSVGDIWIDTSGA